MNTQAQHLFTRALELPESERDSFLAQACGDDADLHLEVQRMLVDAARADSFFVDEDGATLGAQEFQETYAEKEGDVIGPYKLRQQIGEGGFGSVWMAEQSVPISRMVALKVIKAGMDTKQVLARFEAERQALAMMDHPHIAKVLDAGATATGRPYFAMELVKGIPITQYCDEAGLATRERLALFGDVCAAINHAHQKGIIHRDIKPSNVMVTLYADKPVVKVIDFGIAKATQGKLTDRTLFTRFEQFIGTPVYMSPEQANLSAVDIDTRSDIYALGILLYELLTGKPPFDPKSLLSVGYDEMRRIIREVEPPKPSSRLATVAGAERTALAKARHIEADKIKHLIEADLDWIVMKAIEKDRTRRYETANGLAQDLQRFLDNEPVTASPPSAGYQLRKFARRNKGMFAAGAAVFAALLLGVIGTSIGLVRAEKQRREAEEQRRSAQAAQRLAEQRFNSALQFVTDVSEKVAPEFQSLIGATKANETLAQISRTFLESLGETNSNDENYQTSLAFLYANLADALGGVYEPNAVGDYDTALSFATQGLAISRSLLAKHQGNKDWLRIVANAEQRVGTLSEVLGQTDQALVHMRRNVEASEEILEIDPDDAIAIRRVRTAHLHFAGVLSGQGRHAEAMEHYLRYGKEWLDRPVPESADPEDMEMMWSYVQQWVAGRDYMDLGQPAESLPLVEKALGWNKRFSEREPNNARWPRDWSELQGLLGKVPFASG